MPDDLFEFNRVGSPPEREGYALRLGTYVQRACETLRIDEVPKGMLAAIAALLVVFLVLGALLLRSCSQPGLVVQQDALAEQQSLQPSAALDDAGAQEQPSIGVYVAGSVYAPGVYYLPGGSRVCDAINMAGGVTDDADLYSLNLASVLSDSQKVYVPSKGESEQIETEFANVTKTNGLINLNTANEDELRTLVGIGPSLATAIVRDREANGPFIEVSDLTRVSGIGEKTLGRFADKVCV